MTHGLKSLAQQLPQYGRYGDDMVAHISSDEARLLKSLGGSGTINPHTGLPEFFSIGSVFKPVQQAVGQLNPFNPGSATGKAIGSVPGVSQLQNAATQVFQPIEKAVVQPASAGLASFDKAVGKAIPGGWGTVGQVALSMIPGAQPFAIGLGALNGSGVLHKGGKFNLQGAMIGGATAYATSELGEYLRAAGGAPDAALLPVSESGSAVGANGVNAATGQVGSGLAGNSSGMLVDPSTLTSSNTAALNSLSAPLEAGAGTGLQVAPPPSIGSQIMSGNFGDALSQVGTNISEGASNIGNKIVEGATDIGKTLVNAPSDIYQAGINAKDAIANYDYSGAVDNATKGMSDTGSGIKNILGLGEGTAKEAMAAGATSGVKALPMVGLATYGTMSLADLDAQRKFLDEQKASGNIAQAEYDKAMAEINKSTEDARKAVKDNPFSLNPNRDTSIGETFYGRNNEADNLYSRLSGDNRLYASGGSINPPDDQTGMPNQSPMKNFDGGMMGYAAGGMPPRFLSGGGDGMSDSIKASINGDQEARLADGEFVIPADVVSHLGNGSSKAGAKQLYSMMDKVRTARTGRKSQGKQINPRKYLPA